MRTGHVEQPGDKHSGRRIHDQMMRQNAHRGIRLTSEPARPQLGYQGTERGAFPDKAAVAAPIDKIDMHVDNGGPARWWRAWVRQPRQSDQPDLLQKRTEFRREAVPGRRQYRQKAVAEQSAQAIAAGGQV